jgi:hypothetical protein
MLGETGARSSTLRERDIAALRRRVLVARHLAAHVEASATADCEAHLLRRAARMSPTWKRCSRIAVNCWRRSRCCAGWPWRRRQL